MTRQAMNNPQNNIVLRHLQRYCKSENELYYCGYTDDANNFCFQSPCTISQIDEIYRTHHFISLSSFYGNPFNHSRKEERLTTLYGMPIDLDGWNHQTPLSHLGILDKWQDLGFDKSPSAIFRTSEGRFHIILWLEPLAAFPEKISYWKKCQLGLCKTFEEYGADPQPPVNFIRIPGSINYKYHYKPVVEVVHSSESVFTLTEIHQVLQENNVFKKKPKRVNITPLEGIKQIEQGVKHGVTNNALYTLALHYRVQGLSKDAAVNKLTDWNHRNEVAEVYNKFIATINSAYSSNNKPSLCHINRIINRNKELVLNPAPIRTQTAPRIKKSDSYKTKIVQYLQDRGGVVERSMRSLADELAITREYLRQILQDNQTFDVQTVGKGRHSSTTIRLKSFKHNHLKLVHSLDENDRVLMTKVNDQKQGVITEEEGKLSKGK